MAQTTRCDLCPDSLLGHHRTSVHASLSTAAIVDHTMTALMILFAFLLSLLISAAIAPVVIAWYKRHNWLDNPADHKHVKVTHQHPVPRGGGIVVFIAILVTALVFLSPLSAQVVGLLIAAGILMVIGMIDDIFDISPYIRLATGLIVAMIVVLSEIGIEYVTNPFGSGVITLTSPHLSFNTPAGSVQFSLFADSLAIIWIVWSMNIVNWSKGLDGQLPGVVAIAAFFIGLLSLRFVGDPSQIPVMMLAFITSGAYLGLLIWNVYPQRIMPGYGGGSIAGFFLAALSILSGAKLATAILVLAIPTADAVFTITRRLARKKSPFWGDRGHLHHKLLDVLGWSKRQVAAFYWITTAFFGLLALQLKPEQKIFTISLVFILVFGFLIWVKLFISSSKQPDQGNG